MQFTVTYRRSDGAVVVEVVDAINRADCFAQIKARGIAPMSVKDGSAGRMPSHASRGAKGSVKDHSGSENGRKYGDAPRKGGKLPAIISAFVILVGIGFGIWWMLQSPKVSRSSDPEITKKTALPKEVKPASAASGEVRRIDGAAPQMTNAATAKASAPTATLGTVTKAIPAGAFDRVVDENGNITYVKRKSPFTNRVDALVLSAISPGGFPQGLRQWAKRHSKEELIAALKSPVNFNEDDSEKMTADKHSLEEMKSQMVGLLEKGHSLDEVLGEIEPTVNAERTERANAEKTLRRLMKESDPETVREYVRCVNEELKAKGLREIYLPKKFREEESSDLNDGQVGKESDQGNKEKERSEMK